MLHPSDEKPYLTPTEVAQRMNVSPITVRAWAAKGLLAAEVTPGGHRRFLREEVERFIRQSRTQQHGGPLRVLLVDDDRALVSFLLELLGGGATPVALETAHDGFAAGQKVHLFEPDIVLLDFKMPGLNGVDVCRRIKEIPGMAATRVIGMSGYLAPEIEKEMLEAGAECCFGKPLDTDRLLEVMGIEA